MTTTSKVKRQTLSIPSFLKKPNRVIITIILLILAFAVWQIYQIYGTALKVTLFPPKAGTCRVLPQSDCARLSWRDSPLDPKTRVLVAQVEANTPLFTPFDGTIERSQMTSGVRVLAIRISSKEAEDARILQFVFVPTTSSRTILNKGKKITKGQIVGYDSGKPIHKSLGDKNLVISYSQYITLNRTFERVEDRSSELPDLLGIKK